MPWIRIDDHFDEHPKFAKVGPLGMALWMSGLAYCNRNLTDGFIPWSVARNLISWEFAGVAEEDGTRRIWEVSITSGMQGEDVTCKTIIPLLVDAGLWDEVEDGYLIHDYTDYQPTKEQVEEERRKKSEAGRLGGQASAQARAQAGASPTAKQTASKRSSKTQAKSNPVPVPVPDPLVGDKSPTPPVREKKTPVRVDYPVDFESFWQVYPSGHGVKKATYEHWKRIAPDAALAQTIIDAVHGWMQSDKWRRGFVMDAENFLKRQAWDSVPPPQSATNITRIEAPVRHPSERVGRDGLTDSERGWRENPGHKGWSADELMRMANAMEQQERERNTA